MLSRLISRVTRTYTVPFQHMSSRRSIRAYDLDAPVPQEDIDHILMAADWAPTACHNQPLKYYVVSDQEVLSELAEVMVEGAEAIVPGLGWGPEKMFHQAPVVIFQFWDAALSPGMEDLAMYDAGLAGGQLMLMADKMGYGTCPIGFSHVATDQIRELTGASDSEIYCLAITLGRPAEEPEAQPRAPLDSKVFHL